MTDGDYPIIVRWPAMQRVGIVALLVLIAALEFFVAARMFAGNHPNTAELVAGVLFALWALAFLALAWHWVIARIVLERDSIASEGLFSRRELRRDQIAGVRFIGSERLRIVPSDPGAKPITFSTKLLKNEALADWFDDVRNLDGEEIEAAFSAYEQDPRYGATVEERHARLALMQKIESAANWVSMGVGGWALIWPEPFLLAVSAAAALPLVAVALNIWSRNLLTFGAAKRNDFRPSLLMMIVAPAFALLRAATGFHVLDFPLVLEWAPLLTLAVLAALIARNGWTRIAGVPFSFFVLFTLMYCLSTLILADVLLDTTQPRRFQAHVASKHWEQGIAGIGGPRYYMTLDPWGPVKTRDNFRVSGTVYEQAQGSNLACPYLSAGRFGWRWYDVRPCQP